MKFVPFNFQDHGEWVKNTIKLVFCDDTKGIVAIKDGAFVGAMMADSWTHNSVQVHIAVLDPMCFKHKMHYEFSEWVFNTCGIKQMLGIVPANNEKAIKLDKHFGFKEVARLPDAYADGVDYIILRYDRDECKYLSKQEEAA